MSGSFGPTASASRSIVSVSASKTLGLSDANTLQLCSAASTITIPLNATVAFAIGTEILIQRNTSTAVAIAVIGGVTAVDEFGSAISLTAVSNATLIKKIGTDTWLATNPIPNNAFLPGSPTTQTQTAGDSTTKVATTAFVTTAVGSVSTSPGLLVYATQTSSITSNGSLVSVPFSTQPLFTSSLFSGGIFTPTITGLYRVALNTAMLTSTLSSVSFAYIWMYQSTTVISRIYGGLVGNGTYNLTGTTDVQLTAGIAYNFRGAGPISSDAIFSAASGNVNSLTIHRLA